ncbi:MAG TPA: hypothetical protein VGD21_02350 [Lysobacter sp.]
MKTQSENPVQCLPPGWRLEVRGPTEHEPALVGLVSPSGAGALLFAAAGSASNLLGQLAQEMGRTAQEEAQRSTNGRK